MSKKRAARSKYVDYGAKLDNYEWDQWEDEVLVTIVVPSTTKARELEVVIQPHHLKVAIKGKPAIINGALHASVIPDGSTWTIDNGTIEISLQKGTGDDEHPWWPSVIKGDEEISVKDIEGAKYLDDSLLSKIKAQKDAKKKEDAEAKKAAQNQTATPSTTETTTTETTEKKD